MKTFGFWDYVILTCGILSIPTHHAIKNGRFLRNPKDEVYKYRILYGLCWTMIYYFPLVYNLVLQFSILKKIVFIVENHQYNKYLIGS